MDTDIQFNPQTESLSGIVSTLHVVSEHPTGYDSSFEELYSFFNIFQCLNLRRVNTQFGASNKRLHLYWEDSLLPRAVPRGCSGDGSVAVQVEIKPCCYGIYSPS